MSARVRRLLVPFVPVYRMALGFRELRLRRGWEPIRRLRFPVISIGNLSTGGAGKTPFAIALALALGHRGFAVDVLSRGYGRQAVAAARVRLDGTADEFGDEPLVIVRSTGVPVCVARQRYDAGLLAEADTDPDRPRVHILDDGFQHRQLHRDIDILLLNRDDWHDRLLPAGNLREPLHAAMRATVLAIPAEDGGLADELRAWGWNGPVWRLRRRMEVPAVEGPVVAFCGIARPEQFFAGLEAGGLHLAARIAFRDHHRYTERDLEQMQSAAREKGAQTLVTTEKDRMRLEALVSAGSGDVPVLTAGLTVEIEQESEVLSWLTDRLRSTELRPTL
jgi:tetraacyldisaccharide 4'-kinase